MDDPGHVAVYLYYICPNLMCITLPLTFVWPCVPLSGTGDWKCPKCEGGGGSGGSLGGRRCVCVCVCVCVCHVYITH